MVGLKSADSKAEPLVISTGFRKFACPENNFHSRFNWRHGTSDIISIYTCFERQYMCGRYVLEGPVSRIQKCFDAKLTDAFEQYEAGRYNIAPTMQVPVVRINRQGERVLIGHRWGLIPSWAKDASIGAKLNNARGESVHEKPSFRSAFRRFRCLVPASGYYEWQAPPEGTKARKQPFYISPTDEPYFAMAGVCDHWTEQATGELVMSVAIITTTPGERLAYIHDRMPVMIHKEDWSWWLDPRNQDIEALREKIVADDKVQAWPVGFGVSAVGRNREDSPALIQHSMETPDITSNNT